MSPFHLLTDYSSDSSSTAATYCLGRRTAYRMRWKCKVIKVGRIAAIHDLVFNTGRKLYPFEVTGAVRLSSMLPKCNKSTRGFNDYDGWLTMQLQGY